MFIRRPSEVLDLVFFLLYSSIKSIFYELGVNSFFEVVCKIENLQSNRKVYKTYSKY